MDMEVVKKDIEVSASFDEKDLEVLYRYLNRVLSGQEMSDEERQLLRKMRTEIRKVSDELDSNIWYDK